MDSTMRTQDRSSAKSKGKTKKANVPKPSRTASEEVAPGSEVTADVEEAVKRSIQHLYDGNIRDAMLVLKPHGTAPRSPITAQLLQKLHPGRLDNVPEDQWNQEVWGGGTR